MIFPPLDARLPVLLDRLRTAPTDAQAGLRRHAEVIAQACGRTLDEVIAELTPKPSTPTPTQSAVNDSLAAITTRRLSMPPKRAKSRPASQQRPAISISERIEVELRTDPAITDRSIARKLGCSPTMPGRVRRAVGIAAPSRTVRRAGQLYTMHTGKIGCQRLNSSEARP